jgi:hypothetical protein
MAATTAACTLFTFISLTPVVEKLRGPSSATRARKERAQVARIAQRSDRYFLNAQEFEGNPPVVKAADAVLRKLATCIEFVRTEVRARNNARTD